MAILIYHVCLYIVQFTHKFQQIVVSQLENGVYPDQWAFNCATRVEYTMLFICTINSKYSDVTYGIAQLEVIKERRKKAGERVHNKKIQNHVC